MGQVLISSKQLFHKRARALVLGYKAWKLGLNEAQLRSVANREISDKEILEVLEYKEKKVFVLEHFNKNKRG